MSVQGSVQSLSGPLLIWWPYPLLQLIAGMIEDFDDRGVAFVSCKENFDTSTAMGRAMLNLVAVFGQLERDLTSERTVAALAERGKLIDSSISEVEAKLH